MKKFIVSLFGVAIAAAVIMLMVSSKKKDTFIMPVNTNSEKGFVVMELFTSQGCSSCPAADEILGTYAMKNDDHIIPLAFHVDYWNRLGWVDSFSNSKYTERQQEYASKFNLGSIYTPQLVINGQKELVGSEQSGIASLVNKFLKDQSGIIITASTPAITSGRVLVPYSVNTVPSNSSLNAALVQDNAITHIKAGENRGVKLTNYNIVRNFTKQRLSATTGNIALQLPSANTTNGYSVVLFVQDETSGKITGAAKIKL